MSTEEERRIMDKIRESGYPLEVEVGNRFLKERWAVQPQYTYTDRQTNKIRSVDMLVTCFLPKMKIHEVPRMIVECKTSKNPWVFYSVDTIFGSLADLGKVGVNMLDLSALGMTSVSLFTPFLQYNPIEEQIELSQLADPTVLQEVAKVHFFDVNLPRTFTGHVIHNNIREDEPDEFHKSIHQIRGACLDIIRDFPKSPILATVVVRGKIYHYRKIGEQETIEPTSHVLYSTLEFLPYDFEPEKHSFPPTIVDIVAETYLPNYLDLVKKDFEVLSKIYQNLKGRE